MAKTIKQHRRRSSRRSILRNAVNNATLPRNCVCFDVFWEQDSETFHGFIRVHLNLIRPVQMEVQSQPQTLFDVINQDATGDSTTTGGGGGGGGGGGENKSNAQTDAQTTLFHLPKDTSKVIHINSDTTTKEVICSLLSKFKIKDNPRKFALYHKEGTDDKTATMRRLNDDETPLPMCLNWTDEGVDGLIRNRFVLQENDTGEILWDAFSLPELENFLMFLNKEEEEYIKEMKTTYRLLKIQLDKRLKELGGVGLEQDRIEGQN